MSRRMGTSLWIQTVTAFVNNFQEDLKSVGFTIEIGPECICRKLGLFMKHMYSSPMQQATGRGAIRSSIIISVPRPIRATWGTCSAQ